MRNNRRYRKTIRRRILDAPDDVLVPNIHEMSIGWGDKDGKVYYHRARMERFGNRLGDSKAAWRIICGK